MKKLALALIGTACLIAFTAPAFAATVTGQLVDIGCYTKDNSNTGNAHKGMGETCAQDCAKRGQPVGLLTSDGKLYTVTGDLADNKNAKLVPHMSHTVELTGDVTTTGGKMSIAATDLKMVKR
jgi:hypothetical protein